MILITVVVAALLGPWPRVNAAGAGSVAAGSAGSNAEVGGTATATATFTQSFRKGLQQSKQSEHAAAAMLFGQAEQVAVTIDEKAQAAYFQGSAFFEAKDYQRAEQCFQRVAAYGQAQEAGLARNTTLAKYVSLAEIAARDCAACVNPLADFPTGMYLWIKSNMGPATLASVDSYLNAWDNIKIYQIGRAHV
ncbi:MAG TPA: hypothetical protein DF292_00670 [Firmicutes bacterium]|nr:hypothetical protein [Bacillota bacterium]